MSVTIDPRIKARRIAVQRDVGRKRLRRLLLAGGAVGTLTGLWGLTLTPLLDVDRLEVTGAANTGVLGVLAASHVRRGEAMTTVHLGGAAHRIAALPWVQTVDVHRRWPGTIVFHVVERRPAAAVPVKTSSTPTDASPPSWLLVDAEGRQLALVAAPPAGLLHLDIAPVTPELGRDLAAPDADVLQLASTIPAALRDRIVSLHPAADGTVDGTVRLRDGGEAALLLGTPTQTAAKWLALVTILDDTDPARLAQIDVRVPSAPALTRR